ncbi:MAG: EamA family transporter [Chitinophagaceae bacterium]|nr:EamA family transporter [Chitinophagaceae bacterium]
MLSILFIGTSGPLGRMIHISPGPIIFFRSLIALILLFFIIWFSKKSFRLADTKKRKFLFLSGVLLAAHWITYFISLQLSTVAIAMLSMFVYPVITVMLEPFYLKKQFRLIQIPVALLALAGIYILMPAFDINNDNTLGILMGLLSAFFYAVRNLLLKKHATTEDGLVVILHQLLVVVILTIPFLFFQQVSFVTLRIEWYYLLFLGVVTTAMGHTFFVKSLNHFSVSTVSILSNFTPVVGILLGMAFLNETPSGNILLGGSLILITALLEVWLSRSQAK